MVWYKSQEHIAVRSAITCGIASLILSICSALAADTTVMLSSVDLHVRLPKPTVMALGSWSLAQYSSADIYSLRLAVPEPITSDQSPTAVAATYGDSLHVMVAAVPEFLGTVDLLGRLLDLQQLRRSTRGHAPVMTTYSAQKMINAVPAEEIAIEMRDTTNRDSMFTLITSAHRGTDVVVLVLRSRTNPRTGDTWSALYYQRLLASVEMPMLFHRDTFHIVHPMGWSVTIPQAWTNKVQTRRGNPVLLPTQQQEDTTWNSVVVQLPLVQIEFFVEPTTLGDTAVLDYAAHVAQRQGLEPIGWTHIPGWRWYRFLAPRRGETVQTTYGICIQQGRVKALQLTGWQRDVPQIEAILPSLVGAFILK